MNGKHGIETSSVSGMAHRELDKLIDNSDNKISYSKKLITWADDHFGVIKDGKLIKGSPGLPEVFDDIVKEKSEKPKKCRT